MKNSQKLARSQKQLNKLKNDYLQLMARERDIGCYHYHNHRQIMFCRAYHRI